MKAMEMYDLARYVCQLCPYADYIDVLNSIDSAMKYNNTTTLDPITFFHDFISKRAMFDSISPKFREFIRDFYMKEVTLKEYAKFYHLSPDNVRQKILRGSLPAEKRGRDWFLPLSCYYKDLRYKSLKFDVHKYMS